MSTSSSSIGTNTTSTCQDDVNDMRPQPCGQEVTWDDETLRALAAEGDRAAAEMERRMAPMHRIDPRDLLTKMR